MYQYLFSNSAQVGDQWKRIIHKNGFLCGSSGTVVETGIRLRSSFKTNVTTDCHIMSEGEADRKHTKYLPQTFVAIKYTVYTQTVW